MLRRLNNQRGATAVEFALVLPLLILFLFGIIEFSVLLYDKAMITNASREGARLGVVYSTPARISSAEIIQRAENYCKDHLITFGAASPPTVTVEPSDNPPCPEEAASGNSITVSVEYDYDFLVLSNILPSIPLSSESVMRCE